MIAQTRLTKEKQEGVKSIVNTTVFDVINEVVQVFRFGWALAFLFGLVFLVCGLYGSPWAAFQKSADIRVEGEYANGVLTASGILFGIWAIVIANKPKGTSIQASVEKDFFRKIAFESFKFCLGLLILSVWFLVLTAIGYFSSVLSLSFSTLSFSCNAAFLTIFIQHYAFMDFD